jgi:transposase
LKCSGKSLRKIVWKTNQESWARLPEEAWCRFGGCCQYVVLDNLKEGVIHPDIYQPELNPVYAAMLAQYGVVADPCRVRDPEPAATHLDGGVWG